MVRIFFYFLKANTKPKYHHQSLYQVVNFIVEYYHSLTVVPLSIIIKDNWYLIYEIP